MNLAQGPVPVFPGPVDVTAAGTSVLQPATTTVEVAGDDAPSVATLSADLRPEAAAAADTAVRKALTDCMAQKELAPVGCPFCTTPAPPR